MLAMPFDPTQSSLDGEGSMRNLVHQHATHCFPEQLPSSQLKLKNDWMANRG